MKRIVAFILIIVFIMGITSCSGSMYEAGNSNIRTTSSRYIEINAKVESQKICFNKNDVTLNFYYSLYSLRKINLEQAKESFDCITTYRNKKDTHLECTYAIYISKNEELVFEKNDLEELVDLENNVNAQLYKYISYEDAFNVDYGFTVSSGTLTKIDYNHSEEITLPSDLFDSKEGSIYIHVVAFVHDKDNDKYYDDTVFYNSTKTSIKIKYKTIGNNTVVLG